MMTIDGLQKMRAVEEFEFLNSGSDTTAMYSRCRASGTDSLVELTMYPFHEHKTIMNSNFSIKFIKIPSKIGRRFHWRFFIKEISLKKRHRLKTPPSRKSIKKTDTFS